MILPGEIDAASVVAEVRHIFDCYEAALNANDLDALDGFFLNREFVVRFGISENLYGIEAIRAFRKSRNADGLKRNLMHTAIHTYGADFATTTTEFVREGGISGRQSQTWVRFPEGWRIVSAHVSVMKAAA